MACEVAQTLVTLNDLADHFSYLTHFNSLLGNKTHCKFDMYTIIGDHTRGL